MEFIAIIIIGIIALAIQVTYERRRTATNLEFQHKRLEAEAKNWADILEKATISSSATASALIAKSVAAASNNVWREGQADKLRNATEAERQARENAKMHDAIKAEANRPITSDIYHNAMRDRWEDRYGREVPAPWPYPGATRSLTISKPAPIGKMGADGILLENGQMVAMYDVMTDSWKDRSGQTIPDPRQNAALQEKGRRLTALRSSSYDPYESELEAQARRASQSAMMDTIATGTGMMSFSSEGAEHVPAEKFQGGGGSFDGGGASGDYGRSETCSSASASADTSSSDSASASCSSSDSGASSSPSD